MGRGAHGARGGGVALSPTRRRASRQWRPPASNSRQVGAGSRRSRTCSCAPRRRPSRVPSAAQREPSRRISKRRAVAHDQIGLLPDHRIAHRHGHGMVRLAAAGAAGPAVDGRLPARAGRVAPRGARAVAVRGRALTAARDGDAPPALVQPGAGAAALRRRTEPKPERVLSARRARRDADRRRRLAQRLLRSARATPTTSKRAHAAAAARVAASPSSAGARSNGSRRQRRVVVAIRCRRRHHRPQAEAIGQARLHAQARVLAHHVLGDVVEAPVRFPQRRLALRERVTQLVEHQLRQRVVVVQRVRRRRSRCRPARRWSRTRRPCARAGTRRRAAARRQISSIAAVASGLRVLPFTALILCVKVVRAFSAFIHFAFSVTFARRGAAEIIRQPSCLTGAADQTLASRRVRRVRLTEPCNADFTTRRPFTRQRGLTCWPISRSYLCRLPLLLCLGGGLGATSHATAGRYDSPRFEAGDLVGRRLPRRPAWRRRSAPSRNESAGRPRPGRRRSAVGSPTPSTIPPSGTTSRRRCCSQSWSTRAT